ncbi:energy transducer TonB [uncultured Ruegeria sp.]|uniref:energy transducer TonB family protein n=1 Tax=uncultured Ruegeria sp. TaxID=259304 RepID=UPI00261E5261|nr:TonB family protein [uncultured Ruegeria sp.]
MIRRSVFVAILAISISVLAHLWGLSVTVSNLPSQSSSENRTDTIELNNTFEEFADAEFEPVQPEPTEAQSPPVESTVEPEEVEIPTSDARVASPNPQQTFAPDTGESTIVQPEAPDEVVVEPVEQDLDDADEPVQAEGAATLEPETVAETPVEASDDAATTVEPASVEKPVLNEQQQLAALPDEISPVAPTNTQTVEPVIPVEIFEPLEEDTELPTADAESDESEQALVSSLRPRLRGLSPKPALRGALDPSSSFENLRFPEQTIESPLTTYQRQGVDVFRQSSGATRSGGRGPGNSDTTNYAGQVLVHLNRAPIVYVAASGFARVFFQIDPDGTLAWVDIVESSGSPDIERAAKEQVRTAAPFPRPPGGVSRKLSFYYQIR